MSPSIDICNSPKREIKHGLETCRTPKSSATVPRGALNLCPAQRLHVAHGKPGSKLIHQRVARSSVLTHVHVYSCRYLYEWTHLYLLYMFGTPTYTCTYTGTCTCTDTSATHLHCCMCFAFLHIHVHIQINGHVYTCIDVHVHALNTYISRSTYSF